MEDFQQNEEPTAQHLHCYRLLLYISAALLTDPTPRAIHCEADLQQMYPTASSALYKVIIPTLPLLEVNHFSYLAQSLKLKVLLSVVSELLNKSPFALHCLQQALSLPHSVSPTLFLYFSS